MGGYMPETVMCPHCRAEVFRWYVEEHQKCPACGKTVNQQDFLDTEEIVRSHARTRPGNHALLRLRPPDKSPDA